MKYRKIALVEAIIWTGDNLLEVERFRSNKEDIGHNTTFIANEMWDRHTNDVKTDGLFLGTLEGRMKASIGDYIIRGIKGECYACKPDIFKLTYEEVEDGR